MAILLILQKRILLYTNEREIDIVSKLHPIGARQNKHGFVYNKDAGTYVCKAVHLAIGIKRELKGQGTKNPRTRYMFDVEKCKICPFKDECYIEGAKSKSFYVSHKSPEHTDQLAFQKIVKERNLFFL